MDYLPNNATIDEACEWLQDQTGQKWTLPRLLEDGHLTPYVWSEYKEGYPQIWGNSREGYLTKMVYHGDIVRLAADRNEALLTMFTTHDGNSVSTTPGWRVELKEIRFKKSALERVAEIINKTAPTQTAPPVPVPTADKVPAPVVNLKAKGRTWLDVSSPHIVEVMRAGQYATCKELYRTLEAKAGPDSPFDKGTGANRGSLFVREIAQSLNLKTVQNKWKTLRELAQK